MGRLKPNGVLIDDIGVSRCLNMAYKEWVGIFHSHSVPGRRKPCQGHCLVEFLACSASEEAATLDFPRVLSSSSSFDGSSMLLLGDEISRSSVGSSMTGGGVGGEARVLIS